MVEVRIREGHPVEVLLLPVDLVYHQVEVSHPEDLQARVFVVTYEDADTASDVVTGMISVFECDAHILIDPGATHSFISMWFISNVNVEESQPINFSIVVSLPIGDSRLAKSVYVDSKVIFGGQEFLAYLILLDIHDLDVILGMDWLSRHHDIVYCYRKEVRFCKLGETEVVFYGLRKILPNSIMTAMKASKISGSHIRGT